MDDFTNFAGVIDPEVRAHVYSLVTALGGASASEDGRYVLGDDALACLKDIKRWLKLHDEKLSRLDVTRCLAEAHLVKGDLLEILGQWPEEAMNEKWRGRIALAGVELIVPLTWPIEKDLMSEVTRNQHRHLPYIKIAQITYKREILEHPSGDILKKAIRLALPAMAVSGHERSPRDEGIIKLVTYFIRNIAMISAPANLPVEWNEQEVSRSSTIKAFDRQNVFAMLLSMASNVSTDFKTQDVIILEVLFHILKGVDPKRLFMTKPQRSVAASSELRDLMGKETDLLKTFAKHAPTRHNRFGTMVWIERSEAKMSMVSGQDVLRNGPEAFEKMDKSKKWNKPKRRPKDDKSYMSFDLPEILTDDANERLRIFVENFLDSGFNPVFAHLRKAIEREADRILIAHSRQFWYLVSWFLRAESERRKATKGKSQEPTNGVARSDIEGFGVVASVLNQETFVLLNRYMQFHLDNKEWNELDAGMRCFTQILLTVQEMADSPLDEDQEIADNIQNNIFYEETTHDRILAILKGYKDQNFSYLDAATELSHVFLRLLERYSKENGDLQIRSRRRIRTKKKAKGDGNNGQGTAEAGDRDGNASEADDEEQAARILRERKFDFNRFAAKFVTQSTVNTFVKFIGFYQDLSTEQLKRAHRFFYRVAFKQDMTVLLFRLDIIHLFNRMIKSSGALRGSDPTFSEWTELVKQIFRRLVKKMEQRPELAVELLFSKIPSTCHYLEYGHEKQTISVPRAPAELEVRGGLQHDEQVGVVVAALIADSKDEAVEWVSRILKSAADERQSWEALGAARTAETMPGEVGTNHISPNLGDGDSRLAVAIGSDSTAKEAPSIPITPESNLLKVALFKDNKLRLLLGLISAERHGLRDDPNATWTFPPSLTSEKLFGFATIVEQHSANPQQLYGQLEDNPITAAEMLKRVASAKPMQTSTLFSPDNDEDLDDFPDDDGGILFPAGGPTARKSDVLERLRAKRRQKKVSIKDDDVDAEALEQRRLARQRLELEKRRKIKSTEFVHESDDESDEDRDRDFFAREKEVARNRAQNYDRVFEEEKQKYASGSNKRKHAATESSIHDRNKRLRSSDSEVSSNESDSVNIPEIGETDGVDTIQNVAEDSDQESLPFNDARMRRKALRRHESVTADDTEDEHRTPFSSQSEPHVEKLALMESDSNRGTINSMIPLAKLGGSQQENVVQTSSDDEDAMPAKRGRARMAILYDSDDE